MKKFIIDQTLFLLAGIVGMILLPIFWVPFITVLFEIVGVICWGYLCRRILLLPFDLFSGKVSQTAYYASQDLGESLEFFKNTAYWEWKFYSGNNQTLTLLAPIAATKKEDYKIVQPPKDVKLKITYFRFSKILLEWKQI